MNSFADKNKNMRIINPKIESTYKFIKAVGIDLRSIFYFVLGISQFIRDFLKILKQRRSSKVYFPITEICPMLEEKTVNHPFVSKHYFIQDLFVAQKIFMNMPVKHTDIGSRVDGFVANIASFRKIEVFDIRYIKSDNYNIIFRQCDLMSEIDPSFIDYCDSLSCLHALEHFGLGRYGDQISYDGYLKGFYNLNKILKKNGKLYFSVPIGPQRIVFNAHRIFSVQYLLDLFRELYHVDNFAYIDDYGNLNKDISIEDKAKIRQNYGCTYGCGIFELTKR